MAAKFLNDQLISSSRFAPGTDKRDLRPVQEEGQQLDAGDTPEQVPPQREAPPPAPEADLQAILETEASETRQSVTQRELQETARRKREVVQRIHEIITELEQERESAEARKHFFSGVRQELDELPDDITADDLRQVRQAVHNAHLETVKFDRDRTQHAERERGSGQIDISTFSFGQLSRLGLAMTWPLAAAVLLVGVVIAVCLYVMFSG